MDEVADVYAVGECPYPRWRSFADASRPWTPAGCHDELLMKRNYHARNAYELGIILGITPDYTCRESLEFLRVTAVVELRCCEVELAAFQLTTNQIGIKMQSRDDLYAAAAFLHGAHLHLCDEISKSRKSKRGRKDVLAMAPYRTDSTTALARSVDLNLHALHVLLRTGMPMLRLNAEDGDMGIPMRRLGQLLGLAMRAFDKVVKIFD